MSACQKARKNEHQTGPKKTHKHNETPNRANTKMCAEATQGPYGLSIKKHEPTGAGWAPGVLRCRSVCRSHLRWLRVKNKYQKKGYPGKWKQGLKPAVFRWFNFDPHPCVKRRSALCRIGAFVAQKWAARVSCNDCRLEVLCQCVLEGRLMTHLCS